ncbi:MAG: hypothetical protein WKF84_05935 [Pyrinomonadaceae bacterium]
MLGGGGHPAGWKTSDGKLWFATIKGAVMIDPQNAQGQSSCSDDRHRVGDNRW